MRHAQLGLRVVHLALRVFHQEHDHREAERDVEEQIEIRVEADDRGAPRRYGSTVRDDAERDPVQEPEHRERGERAAARDASERSTRPWQREEQRRARAE